MTSWQRIVFGALAGLNGAACMSALRVAAYRVGLVDRMPPQVLEEWLAARTPGGADLDDTGHHIADHVLHLGIGASSGALYAALLGRRGHPLLTGAAFGLAVWGFAFAVALPRLGVTRHAAASHPVENALNVAAHLLYGVVTGLMVDELPRQRRGIRSDVIRRAFRTG